MMDSLDDVLRMTKELAEVSNPDTNPYASHYRIIEILQKWLTTTSSDLEKAIVHTKLGTTYLQVEQPHDAQIMLEQAGLFFFPHVMHYIKTCTSSTLPDLPIVRIDSFEIGLELLTQLGILWYNRTQALRALGYFQIAREFCSYLETIHGEIEILVSTRIHIYFYLAQVYGTLKDLEQSAHYCLSTLELQFQELIHATINMKVEWIKNAMTLIKYYMEQEAVDAVATCLVACEYVYSILDDLTEEQEIQKAEIAFAWTQLYHLILLLAQRQVEGYWESKNVYLTNLEKLVRKQLAIHDDTPLCSSVLGMTCLRVQDIITFDQVRIVFKAAMKASEIALQIYQMDGFVTAHVQLIQLQSKLYRRVLYWETDEKRIIAMHLRRLTLLTNIFKAELNTRAYCALLQECYYEAAEIASDIYDLKLKRASQELKTNAYALKAIHWYQQYLFLFYDNESNLKDPDQMIVGGESARLSSSTMEPGEVKAILHGYFGLARMCGRICFTNDHDKTVVFWKKSILYHQAVLHLMTQYTLQGSQGQSVQESFQIELNMCKEMIELLPEKINQLVYNGKML